MIGMILLTVLFWAVFGLCAWNLWGSFSTGKIYVRSTLYSRDESEAWFWIAVFVSTIFSLMTGSLALLMTAGILGLV